LVYAEKLQVQGSCRFSADDVPHVKLSYRVNVLDDDQHSTGFLKHVENKVKPLAGETKNQKRKILLLGSSSGREIGPMLKEHLGTEYKITSIFKPSTPLANVMDDPGKLGNDLTR